MSRAHRWAGDDHPLSGFHGGTANAAKAAVAEARRRREQAERDAQRYAEWEARGKPPSPPQPRKDRMRPKARAAPGADRPMMVRIAAIQGGVCSLCWEPLDFSPDLSPDAPLRPSFEHVIPRSLGGPNVGGRLVAHRVCNSRKGSSLPTGCELVWLLAVNARLGLEPTRF